MSGAIKNCNAGEGCHVMFILLEEIAKNPVWLIPSGFGLLLFIGITKRLEIERQGK